MGPGQHHSHGRKSSTHNASSHPPSKHQRTSTAPEAIVRIPSTGDGRGRRLSNPTTPSLTPSAGVSTASGSYFSPQPTASGADARSPANRRPPASRSGHGIDTSRGPPIALITRGSYSADIARRSQKPSDFAFAQQQLVQLGLVSPGAPQSPKQSSAGSSVAGASRKDNTGSVGDPVARTPSRSHESSRQSDIRREEQMASSVDDSSDYDSSFRSHGGSNLAMQEQHQTKGGSSTEGDQTEDLFLNIAQDAPQREDAGEGITRVERRRSRIARAGNRQSLPTNTYSSPVTETDSVTPNANKTPSSIDTRQAANYRKPSHLPSPSLNSRVLREQSPASPANILDNPRSRFFSLSPQPTFPLSKSKDQDASQVLPQYGRRRPSFPDSIQTPPNRAHTYRPSNLHYSSSRDNDSTPHIDTPPETATNRTYSRADGTDSVDSVAAPSSVWDELDDLKSRIRKLELTGKLPATSGAAVSNGSGERPRTATTTVTTVSSSPKHYRKPSTSPSESTVGGHTNSNLHPLLHAALAKAKDLLSPSIYRVLEATASEALELAALTGSAGPQGTLYSASSIINGVTVPDRQVRRKADSLCRSLTELCIALCEVKTNPASPAVRTTTAGARRPSIQVNGDSHTPNYTQIRASVEPESGAVPRSSPSRALSRIEARRSSIMNLNGAGSVSRDPSQEPPNPAQSQAPNRFNRAGTSLLRTRRATNEDEDPTLRAPSRAMTDFSQIRSSNRANRLSRDYNSQTPVPELQPSPSLQHTSSLRRPNGATTTTTTEGVHNPSSSLLRDGSRRYLDRQTPPVYDKTITAESAASEERRRAQPVLAQYTNAARVPTGGGGLSRTGSLGRRYRGGNANGD